MMLRIAFSPADLKTTDEAWPAFQAGGITLKYWDYFNLNIQKSLWIEYQSVETVTKQVLVGVHCNQPAAE